MNIDIRAYVKKNFENTSTDDIKQSIEESLQKGDDITLPGLGYFFEIIWNSSNEQEKETILNYLSSAFKWLFAAQNTI